MNISIRYFVILIIFSFHIGKCYSNNLEECENDANIFKAKIPWKSDQNTTITNISCSKRDGIVFQKWTYESTLNKRKPGTITQASTNEVAKPNIISKHCGQDAYLERLQKFSFLYIWQDESGKILGKLEMHLKDCM